MAKKKKKLHQRMWFWILLSLLLVGAWRSFMNTPTEPPADREYIEITVDQLYDELNDNALKAEDTYQDAYVAVTGRLGVIDSDGDYISLDKLDEQSLDDIHCSLSSDEQKDAVKEHSRGDTIVVKGKITDIGEIQGYYMAVDSIE